jgi:hypothetical protein
MTGFGLIERQRGLFANALKPLKGGTSGMAEIRRAVRTAGTRTWAAANPPEMVAVHYEQKRTDGGVPLDLSVSGAPGYTVFFDGRLATPVKDGDRILVNGLTLVVEMVNEIGNLTPIASVDCMVAP